MKTNIRIIGMLILLMSFISCTNDADNLEPTLIGLYRYKSAEVGTNIKIDDNTYSNNLIFMKGTECIFDNTWEFRAEKAILREGETSCDNGGQKISENEVIGEYKYIYDKENHTIKLVYESGYVETLKNVKLGYSSYNKHTLSFELWNDTVEQVVTYYLEAD